jgi:hypothetical protein
MSFMAASVFIIHAKIELSENVIYKALVSSWKIPHHKRHRTANPTRVAIEELQLQDLKNIEAAVVCEPT